jgi:hypothetical protein
VKSNSQSEKGTESQNYFMMQIEQFETFGAASIYCRFKTKLKI